MKTYKNVVACLIGLPIVFGVNTVCASTLIETGGCKFVDMKRFSDTKDKAYFDAFNAQKVAFFWNLYDDGTVLWSNDGSSFNYNKAASTTANISNATLTGFRFQGTLINHKGIATDMPWVFTASSEVQNLSAQKLGEPRKLIKFGVLDRPATSKFTGKCSLTGRRVTKDVLCYINVALSGNKLSTITIGDKDAVFPPDSASKLTPFDCVEDND